MGPDQRRIGERFAGQGGDRFHLEGGREDLRKMKNAAQRATFFILVFGRTTCLEVQLRAARARHPCGPVCGLVMMQPTRKDVDHKISGQRGTANQGAAQKRLHRSIRHSVSLEAPARDSGDPRSPPRWYYQIIPSIGTGSPPVKKVANKLR
jgi:hypothetical protein